MSSIDNIKIFDTTMRDGELTPGVQMNIQEKISIAKMLEEMGVDVIEVGYPGHFEKDEEEVFNISKIIKNSIICGLASSQEDEIIKLARSLKPTEKGRINTFTNINLKSQSKINKKQILETIGNSIALARNYCADVQWSAFDATRSEPDFLCKAIETAIAHGATTISIPDSLGIATPKEFSALIQTIIGVPNIDKALISVHCHNDIDMAVENSIAALKSGARQIECAINGLGARKGNADLAAIVTEIFNQKTYQIKINTSLLNPTSNLVKQITINKKQPPKTSA